MDTLIIIVMIVGAVVGYVRGAFKMAAGLVGLAAGVMLAAMLYKTVAGEVARQTGSSDEVASVVTFLLIAILVPLLISWLASLLTKFFQTIHLNFINRLVGAAIGLLAVVLLMSFAFNILDLHQSHGGTHPEQLEQRSPLYYTCKQISQPFIPDMLIVTAPAEEPQPPHTPQP